LKGLEEDAAKVSKSLERMTNSFTGQKIIQDANLATESFKRLAEQGIGLTETEQKKLNALVTEGIAKYNALGQQAPADMQKVAAATKSAQTPTQALGASFTTLFASFSAANLATQALGMVTAKIGEFVDTGMKLAAVEGAYRKLADAAGQSSEKMLATLQTATRGMVANYDLMAGANKALLLGLPVTESSMAELAGAATALGKAMGQDATKSLDDLITALGRSSPLILDNLGLTVKVGQANEAYAAKLGKTVEQLSDAEKKMAFYEAAMEAARKKTAELGEQSKTFGEILTTVWTSIGNHVSKSVSDFNIGMGSMLSSWENFMAAMKAGGGGQAGSLGYAVAAAAEAERQKAQKLLDKKKDDYYAGAGNLRPTGFGAANLEGAFTTTSMSGAEADKIVKQLTDSVNAMNAAEKASAEAAAATATIRKQLYGTDAINNAKAYVSAIRSIGDVSKMSAADQQAINKAVGEGILAYQQLGQTAPQAMKDLYAATEPMLKTPDVIRGIGGELSKVGDIVSGPKWTSWQAPMVQGLRDTQNLTRSVGQEIGVYVPAQTKKAEVSFKELSTALTQLATVAGGSFGAVASGLATITTAAQTAKSGIGNIKDGLGALSKGSTFTGILDMASGIGGIASAAMTAINIVSKLFSMSGPSAEQKEGRSLIAQFHDELVLTLTDAQKLEAGNEAWKQDTIAIRDAYLAAGKSAEEAEAATKALWESAHGGATTAQAAIDSVKAVLDQQTKAQQDATGATEEQAQATIETATQAALALEQLGPKITANEAQWQAWSQTVTGALDAIAGKIRSLPSLPILDGSTAATTSQSGSGAYDAAGGIHGNYETAIYLDGDKIARSTAKRLPAVLKGVGV